jgi:hypothetical protein
MIFSTSAMRSALMEALGMSVDFLGENIGRRPPQAMVFGP